MIDFSFFDKQKCQIFSFIMTQLLIKTNKLQPDTCYLRWDFKCFFKILLKIKLNTS